MRDKIRKIANMYGYDSQSRQCVEEMAELTQAINKFWRNDLECGDKTIFETPASSPCLKSIKEEIADVQIMLWQLCYLLDLDIEHVIEEKLDRQLERIEKQCSN